RRPSASGGRRSVTAVAVLPTACLRFGRLSFGALAAGLARVGGVALAEATRTGLPTAASLLLRVRTIAELTRVLGVCHLVLLSGCETVTGLEGCDSRTRPG